MSSGADPHRLRATFDEVPELYDRARPTYPASLFDDLVALTGLQQGASVLEIGCGTGKATVPLAERGFEVVCVELGPRLAEFARQRLAGFANVEIVEAAFETWQPTRQFDAVVAFTAFHWVDAAVRYERSASALREDGSLAVVATQHVRLDEADRFWVDAQEVYDEFSPSDDNRPPPFPGEVGDLSEEIGASGRFRNVAVRRHLWQVRYNADEYIAVLDTYSGHRTLADDARRGLHDGIRAKIEREPGASVTKTYLATLNVARRLAG